jgi:flavodoxin
MSHKEPILIAYYSRSGNNYVNGQIVDVPVGNTQRITELIQYKTGGDLLKIDTVKPYPLDYNLTTKVAMDEFREKKRPVLKDMPDNLLEYDVVFLGFPNWWGTMPMAVFTFLETYRFNGKRIIPFCTHEGSGMSDCVKDIRKICIGAEVDSGIAIYGHDSHHSTDTVNRWIDKLEIG